MPYYITNDSPDCDGWATIKEDGEVMGCHATKGDAVDQMVALSIEEGMEPGGERDIGDPPAIIVDIDGTLITFEGEPIRPVIDYVNSADAAVMVVTGRVQDDGTTVDELASAGVDYDGLWMKPSADVDSVEWKRSVAVELLDEHDVVLAIDDDRAARDAYRALGIETMRPAEFRSEARQVDLDVPGYITSAAALGVELWEADMAGDGVTEKTVREARDMADGRVTEDKVIRANAWAARHAVDLDAPKNSDTDNDEWPGAGAVAHYLWGINPLDPDPAREWFARKAEQIQQEQERMNTTMVQRSTDNIVRQLGFEVAPNDDGLTLDGYGAVFNQWTDIEDSYGTYRERIAPGAFKRTLGQRMPILQFDHGSHPLIGSIPLGRITSIVEDEHGLRVKARLSDNWLVQPVRDAIRDGGITGMSFRFRIMNEDWGRGKDGVEERTIREVALYEVGPVVFPAYEQTSVGVRSQSVLRELADPHVRSEVAAILAAGTDIESLANETNQRDSSDQQVDEPHEEPSVTHHGSIPTRAQRKAKAVIAGIPVEGTTHEQDRGAA